MPWADFLAHFHSVDVCKAHAGTVWAMCGNKEVAKWGIGPEGEKGAIGNCNDGCNSGRFKCPVKGSSWVAFGGEFGSPTYIVDGKRCLSPLALDGAPALVVPPQLVRARRPWLGRA